MQRWIDGIESDGFALVENGVAVEDCLELVQQFERQVSDESLKSSRGTVFAARNLIDDFPASRTVWREVGLVGLLENVLGPDAGLVRVLFFDKPADRSWNLPWHKDMTIAVADNSVATSSFTKPTHKSGVDHFEAPTAVLENMLTLRLHLDEVTERNGPLRVIPGSHANGKAAAVSTDDFVPIHAGVGDVLAMRPLISHSSGHTEEGSGLRRRILHLEFCGTPKLPDGVSWHRFVPVKSVG